MVGVVHGIDVELRVFGGAIQCMRHFCCSLAPNRNCNFQIIEPQGTSESGNAYDTLVIELDWQRIGLLELRNWRPGDQYTPAGRSGEKIKFLFQQERIPIWERQGWPVLTNRGRIVWARRFGVAAEFAASATSRRVVRVIEIAESELADVTQIS